MGHPPIFLAMWVIEGRLTLRQAEWIWNQLQNQMIPTSVAGLVIQLENLLNRVKAESQL